MNQGTKACKRSCTRHYFPCRVGAKWEGFAGEGKHDGVQHEESSQRTFHRAWGELQGSIRDEAWGSDANRHFRRSLPAAGLASSTCHTMGWPMLGMPPISSGNLLQQRKVKNRLQAPATITSNFLDAHLHMHVLLFFGKNGPPVRLEVKVFWRCLHQSVHSVLQMCF